MVPRNIEVEVEERRGLEASHQWHSDLGSDTAGTQTVWLLLLAPQSPPMTTELAYAYLF
jgi:hypothetical protein